MFAQKKLKKIVVQELEEGKSPQAVMTLAKKAGYKEIQIEQIFQSLIQSPALPFVPSIQSFLQQKKAAPSPSKLPTKSLWDPAGMNIEASSLDIRNKKLQKKLQKYNQNPRLPLRNLLLFSLPGIITLTLLIFFHGSALQTLSSGGDSNGIFVLILPFLPIFIYWHYVRKLQRDLIKYLIAQEKQWFYNPNEDTRHWTKFNAIFPEMFRLGDESQNMQDEFWGKFKGPKKLVDFYSGIFEYTEVHRDSEGRRTTTTYRKTVFAIRLDKKLKTDFQLVPDSFGSKVMNFFSRKNIDTESAEFNKTFDVFYNGKKDEKALEIVKTLSPALQTKLIQLSEHEKFSLMFRNDVAIFMIKGQLLKKMKTNFFRDVKLDPRDKEAIEERMNTVLDIATDMVKYLD